MSARFELRGEHGPELEFPEALEVRVLRIRPGDTLVLLMRQRVTDKQAAEMGQMLERSWPDNKIMILDSADLAVIRKEAGDGDG